MAALLGLLISTNLEILNQGNYPTFCNVRRLEVTDITLGSLRLLESFKSWEVSSEPSLSNHKHTPFNFEGSVPAHLIRNAKGTDWDFFGEKLKGSLYQTPEINMKDEAVYLCSAGPNFGLSGQLSS
jgi:hypothetical protein